MEQSDIDEDLNRLACCLKNAIFSKFISNYLIEKTEQMWIKYDKLINEYLKSKDFHITCSESRPSAIIELEEVLKEQQEKLTSCERELKVLCSSRKRLRSEDKYSVPLQSKQASTMSTFVVRVPRTPKCIDGYKTNRIDSELVTQLKPSHTSFID